MEPQRLGHRHNVVLADISDIHALGAALHRHALDLTSVAADLTAARASGDSFGAVGSGFVAALNDALAREAHHVTQLAGRLAAATSSAGAAAEAYRKAELRAGRSITTLGV